MKRKLTTILCADGVRFGARMQADEAAALDQLRRARARMAELFARREGRQINTWGDAVIAEFASVVEAVRCAVEIQEAMASENDTLPPERRLLFRIGVNLGDVMIDGDDIYGDGVNLAARLQEVAEPGGIVVSAAVHEFAHRQLAVAFDDLGEKRLKNMEAPVACHAVRVGRRNEPAPEPEPAPAGLSGPIRISDADAFTKTGGRLDALRSWVRAQPRRVRVSAAMIVFFFLINLLFSGIATPWFIFPSLPFALHILLHARRTGGQGAPRFRS